MRRPPRSRAKVDPDKAVDVGAIRRAALLLMSRRDFASTELSDRLRSQGYAADPVADAILELVEERLLDDQRYVTHFVAWHSGRGHGPARIRQDLAATGLPSELVSGALEAGPDFAALCREVRTRRFGAELPAEWKEKARQARFLQYRGFSSDHIRSAFGPDFDLEE
jgi:regulatory protein